MVIVVTLLIVIYILNLIDYCQTAYAIQHFGLGVEINPIMRFIFRHNCEIVFKVILPAILLIALGFIVKVDRKQIWKVYFLAALYFLLITHNFVMLAKMGVF